MLDWFHDRVPCHSARYDKIDLTAFKAGVLSRGVTINEEDAKGGVNGKVFSGMDPDGLHRNA